MVLIVAQMRAIVRTHGQSAFLASARALRLGIQHR